MINDRVLTIIKYTIKEHFFAFMPKKEVANMPKNYILRLIVILWSYVFFAMLFIGVMKVSAMTYVPEGLDYMYFAMFGMMLTMTIFLLYIPQILANTFSKGAVSVYQTLPIGQGELFLSKLLGGVISFFDFFLYFILTLFVYFQFKAFDITVFIGGIILFLPLVTIPYGLISIVILLIKKFTNVNRHTKLVKNLGYLLMFGLMVLIYWFAFSSSMKGRGEGPLDSSMIAGGLSRISNIFFNAKFFGLGLGGSLSQRLIFSLILIGLGLLVCLIAYKLGDRYYFDAVLDERIESKKEVEKRESRPANFVSSSQFKTIFRRDIKTIFSNLAFLSSTVSMALIATVMLVSSAKSFLELADSSGLQTSLDSALIFFVAFGLGLFIWLNGGTCETSLSREGKSFYLFQTLPVDPFQHMLARLSVSILIAAVFNLVIVGVISFILKLVVANAIIGFFGIELASIFGSIFNLYFGTFGINTKWKKPNEIMKGNVRMIIIYLASLVVMGLLAGIFAGIYAISAGSFLLAGLIVGLLIISLTVLAFVLCLRSYKRGFMDV